MTFAQPDPMHLRSDSGYQEAMASLQQGNWSAAVAAIESLRAKYPESAQLVRMLEEAQFKARLETGTSVRAKRWAFNSRLLRRVLVLLTIVALIGLGGFVVKSTIGPVLNATQLEVERRQLLAEANGSLRAGDLDIATERFQSVLALVADDLDALEGLARVAEEIELFERYEAGVLLQDQGNCADALQTFAALLLARSDYRDVNERIVQCSTDIDVEQILVDADAYYRLGLHESAIGLYTQARRSGARKVADGSSLDDRLAELHLRQGREILRRPELTPTEIEQALDQFRQALKYDPSSVAAAQEQRLAVGYLNGRTAFTKQDWDGAALTLSLVYEERKDYMDGAIVPMLYEAYVGAGDNFQEREDCARAYEQYGKALALPVEDKTLAETRRSGAVACLTPTPTPTVTPLPTGTPAPEATATMTPVPRRLDTFRGQIVFKSDNPDQPGYWAMDPDGNNRTYIGEMDDRSLASQYDELLVKYRESPDGQYYVYVDKLDGRAQIFIADRLGRWPARALTRLTGIAYDPAWAPDGSYVVFVTQENESDDIWVVSPDASVQHALMRNDWEWDKEPTWSPDSTRIAFWSNRYGAKQIYVMAASGRNVANVSNVPWDEYSPIWIR